MGFVKDIQQSADAHIANTVKLVDESLVMEQVSRKSIPKLPETSVINAKFLGGCQETLGSSQKKRSREICSKSEVRADTKRDINISRGRATGLKIIEVVLKGMGAIQHCTIVCRKPATNVRNSVRKLRRPRDRNMLKKWPVRGESNSNRQT